MGGGVGKYCHVFETPSSTSLENALDLGEGPMCYADAKNAYLRCKALRRNLRQRLRLILRESPRTGWVTARDSNRTLFTLTGFHTVATV